MSEERPVIKHFKLKNIEIEGRKYESNSPYVDLEQDNVSTCTANNHYIPINEIILEKISVSEIEDINRMTGPGIVKNQESCYNLQKNLQKQEQGKDVIDLTEWPQININNINTNKLQSDFNDANDIHENSLIIKEEINVNNFTYFTQYNPSLTETHDMFLYLRISDFNKFLEQGIDYQTEFCELFIPRWDLKLLCKAILTPNADKNNFSLNIEFTEDNRYNQFSYQTKEINLSNMSFFSNKVKKNNKNEFSLLEEGEEDPSFTRDKKKNIFGKKKVKSKAKNLQEDSEPINEDQNSYLQNFSERLQKILQENQVTFEYLYGFFNKSTKSQFPKQPKGKINLNQSNIIFLEDLYEISELVYDGLINPLIIRIKFSLPGKLFSESKCEEYMGIVNEGNTCYANSVLQSIYHIPILRKATFAIPSQEETSLFHVQKIFYQLQANKGKINKVDLFNSLNWLQWNSQQDAQEFFCSIFDLLSVNEKIMLDNSAIISDKCEGIIESTIKCLSIDKESSKKENFHFLQLDLENCEDLIQCIEKYISVEHMCGDNQYEIENGNKYDAIRSSRYEKIPEILFVHLKRFKFNSESNSMTKVHTRISYPNKIDFSCYYLTKVDDIIHCLYGVIVHDGLIDQGHYFVFLRDFKNNRWIKFNDTKVSIASEDEVFNQNFGGEESEVYVTNSGEIIKSSKDIQRTAYMLIYVQENKIQNLFCDVSEKDIPESLMEIINPPPKRARTTTNAINNNSIFNKSTNNFQTTYGSSYRNFNDLNNRSNLSNSGLVFGGKLNKKMDSISKVFDFPNETSNKNGINDAYPSLDQLNNFLHNVGAGYKSKGKVKDIDRVKEEKSSNDKNQKQSEKKGQKRSKDMKNSLITQILNNKPETDIEISIPLENSYLTNNQTMPHSTTSRIDVKKYISGNKSLLRKFKMKFVEHRNCNFIDEVDVDTSLDKKIICISFMQTCMEKLKNAHYIDIMSVKLVLSNNMGIFIKIINEDDPIEGLLSEYIDKKNQLMFYVFTNQDPVSLSETYTVALHLLPDQFTERVDIINVHNKKGFMPELPIIIKNDKMVENEENLICGIYEILNENYKVPQSKFKNSKSRIF
jgi:hypothetical protein